MTLSITGFTVEVAQLPDNDSFSEVMEGIGIRLEDFAPVYDAIYSTFRKIEQARFNKEGPGWTSLAPSTVAGRESMGIGGEHPILNRSGATYEGNVGGQLRKSLTTKGAKNAVVEYSPDGIFMGTSDPVASYHQYGTHGAGIDHNVSMPARPVVDMTEADAEAFSEVISTYLFGFGLEASGVSSSSDDVFVVDDIGL